MGTQNVKIIFEMGNQFRNDRPFSLCEGYIYIFEYVIDVIQAEPFSYE